MSNTATAIALDEVPPTGDAESGVIPAQTSGEEAAPEDDPSFVLYAAEALRTIELPDRRGYRPSRWTDGITPSQRALAIAVGLAAASVLFVAACLTAACSF